MKRLAAALLLAVAVLGSAACGRSPLSPDGSYTCQTQPRSYCSHDLTSCWQEVDHYTQSTPCPAVPIS